MKFVDFFFFKKEWKNFPVVLVMENKYFFFLEDYFLQHFEKEFPNYVLCIFKAKVHFAFDGEKSREN